MAIWLGRDGGIRLERTQSGPVYSYIRTDDVDAGVRRFSLDKPVSNLFITGDRLEITRVDADGQYVTSNLDFVAADAWPDNAQHPDGAWYSTLIKLAASGFITLWSDALAGHESNAITLVPPSADYRLKIRVLQGDDRCLARTQSWTLNTNRDVADITSLGEGFAKNQATMVSGSGDIDCFFDVLPRFVQWR